MFSEIRLPGDTFHEMTELDLQLKALTRLCWGYPNIMNTSYLLGLINSKLIIDKVNHK